MTEKKYGYNSYYNYVVDNETDIELSVKEASIIMNELVEENERLKKELKVYRKVASCSNCHYHNYDWYDDGDEFEVCDKGNDMSDWICVDWEEL